VCTDARLTRVRKPVYPEKINHLCARGGKPEPVGHRRSKHHHTMSTTHRLKTRIGKRRQATERLIRAKSRFDTRGKPIESIHANSNTPISYAGREARTREAPSEQKPSHHPCSAAGASTCKRQPPCTHPQTPLSQFAPTLLIDGYSTTLSLCTEDIRFCTQRAVLVLA
jgi:hypothetical protein